MQKTINVTFSGKYFREPVFVKRLKEGLFFVKRLRFFFACDIIYNCRFVFIYAVEFFCKRRKKYVVKPFF